MLLEVYRVKKRIRVCLQDKTVLFKKNEILKAFEGSNYETGYYDIFLLRESDKAVMTINLLSLLRQAGAIETFSS